MHVCLSNYSEKEETDFQRYLTPLAVPLMGPEVTPKYADPRKEAAMARSRFPVSCGRLLPFIPVNISAASLTC